MVQINEKTSGRWLLLGLCAKHSGRGLPTFQKCRLSGATAQKTAIFILAAVRTSNPKRF
jgi:hypothetical protein